MMFLIPSLFQFGYKVSTNLTDAVIKVSSTVTASNNAEERISKALIQAMSYDDEMEKEDKEYLIENWKKVDINETTGGVAGVGDVYKYSLNFFMLIILSIVTICLFIFVAVQMAKRIMEIALFKIIGPFCCTSLTNNHSKAFETWSKNTMGLFLITVVQYICIGLLLNMFGSGLEDNGILTGIFLIIGALLFIISSPTLINALLGQQTGLMSAFSELQTGLAMGHFIPSSLKAMGNGTMGALSKGAQVTKGGVDMVSKGSNIIGQGISSVLNKHKGSLNKEQMENVKDNINRGNIWNASRLNKQYTNDNMHKRGFNYNNDFSNSFMRYNPLRNQYVNQENNFFKRK